MTCKTSEIVSYLFKAQCPWNLKFKFSKDFNLQGALVLQYTTQSVHAVVCGCKLICMLHVYIFWYFCRVRLLLNPRYRGLIQANMFSDKLEPKAKHDWQLMVKRYDCRLAAVLSSPTVIDLTTQQLHVIGMLYEADQTSHDIKSLTWACAMSSQLPFPQCPPQEVERIWMLYALTCQVCIRRPQYPCSALTDVLYSPWKSRDLYAV